MHARNRDREAEVPFDVQPDAPHVLLVGLAAARPRAGRERRDRARASHAHSTTRSTSHSGSSASPARMSDDELRDAADAPCDNAPMETRAATTTVFGASFLCAPPVCAALRCGFPAVARHRLPSSSGALGPGIGPRTDAPRCAAGGSERCGCGLEGHVCEFARASARKGRREWIRALCARSLRPKAVTVMRLSLCCQTSYPLTVTPAPADTRLQLRL